MKTPTSKETSDILFLRTPLGSSLAAAALYLLICVVYIVFSDRWVAHVATSPEQILRLQTGKGIAFVLFSSLLIFILCFRFLRRIARAQQALLNQQQALVASERRAAAGLLAHSVAHDMNNVLTVGMANVELLRTHTTLDDAGTEMLHDIAQSFERMHEMTRRMSRTGLPEGRDKPATADLATIVQREIRYIQRHQVARDCAFSYQGPDQLSCLLHESAIRELLENLLLNAADATEGTGRIEIRLSADPRGTTLEVHDNGPGVPIDRRTKIFEPLYTTKPNGMGLGLLSVKAAAKLHQGRVEIVDSPLGGACFRVILPGAVQPAST